VLELGEDEGGTGYLGGTAGVGGDVLEGGPALGEQGEPAFSPAAQVAQQGVPGTGVNIEFLVPGGLFHRGEHADSSALVAAVGEARHSKGGCPVEGGQGVEAGGGDVVDGAARPGRPRGGSRRVA
jgi:hypothetical protein